MDITPSKRSRILTLSECTGMSVRKIAEECGFTIQLSAGFEKPTKKQGHFHHDGKGNVAVSVKQLKETTEIYSERV